MMHRRTSVGRDTDRVSSAVPTRLACVGVLAVVLCGCGSTQNPTATSSTTAAPATTTSAAPAVRIRPLPVRPVQKSQPTTPDKCPPVNPNTPVPPADVLTTCDFGRTTVYTLGPEALNLVLGQVAPPNPLTSGFYEVTLTLEAASAAAWAAFTSAHLHDHVAFVRDDLVLEAPMIEERVTSGRIALTTQTPEAADQLAHLAGRPA
jgi:hypothetical protein